MASQHICELAPWEVAAWKDEGKKPKCKDHRHISKIDACEKTCHGDYCGYFAPVAEWVGPRAIMIKADRIWRPVLSDVFLVLQLVPGTAEPQSKPPQSEQFTPRGLPSIRARQDSRARRSLAFQIPTSS